MNLYRYAMFIARTCGSFVGNVLLPIHKCPFFRCLV